MRKIYLTLIICLAFYSLKAQVAIEKTTTSPSAILDFPAVVGAEGNGGIALPRVTNPASAGITSGTFLVDSATKTVKYYGDGAWVDLTSAKSTAINAYDSSLNEVKGEGIHISDNSVTETLKGVLTLSSDNKALQLPVVEDVTQLLEPPYAGMICYDKKSQSLAVFNGEKWSFWNSKTQ